MASLPVNGSSPAWLFESNRYASGDISRTLGNDHRNGTIADADLSQRIAASIPSHVFDGWSYFGRAVHCLIRGDTRNTVHLGYYAELRAALALMASEGIGVLNRQHFVVAENGDVSQLCEEVGEPLKDGTHRVIWPIYDWWLNQPASLSLVRDVITPGSQPIRRWFSSTTAGDFYSEKNAQAWLNAMGLDLKLMSHDHDARNASSYGPSAIHDWEVMSRSDAVESAVQLWRMFEPTEDSRFDEVDRLFLRRAILFVFEARSNRQRGSNPWRRDFGPFIGSFLNGQEEQDVVETEREYWKRFLDDPEVMREETPLDQAEKESSISSSSFPIEMLSRAALLLRVATGSCSQHMDEVGFGWDSLRFWLDTMGASRGLWEQGSYPESPIDLWADVSEATEELEEAQNFYESRSEGPYSFPSPPHGDNLLKLEECERICLWGLGV